MQRNQQEKHNIFSSLIRENRSFIIFILLMSVFRSSFADWNQVPTGSMLPTIVQGDRILVNKLAYDLRVPFTEISLIRRADPLRGDIVIFDSEKSDKRLVKRIVAVPGDVIEMRDNQLKINGHGLSYELTASASDAAFFELQENLLGRKHAIRIFNGQTRRSTFESLEIPKGYFFAMGDNRDNSADSRMIGLVPRDEIVGRTQRVVLSVDYENNYLPRQDRFWRPI